MPDGEAVESDLAASGEVDTYHFALGTPKVHIVVFTFDDDRGAGCNARIVRKLVPCDYWLSVRHKDPAATGTYAVSVRARAALG